MPIITYNKRGKRAREYSNEVKNPNIQLGQKAGFIDLVGY